MYENVVVEEGTIYMVDEECLRCLEKKEEKNTNDEAKEKKGLS